MTELLWSDVDLNASCHFHRELMQIIFVVLLLPLDLFIGEFASVASVLWWSAIAVRLDLAVFGLLLRRPVECLRQEFTRHWLWTGPLCLSSV